MEDEDDCLLSTVLVYYDTTIVNYIKIIEIMFADLCNRNVQRQTS